MDKQHNDWRMGMRTVVTFLMIVDMMVAQFYSMEACEASSAEIRRDAITACDVTTIIGIILILIAKFC